MDFEKTYPQLFENKTIMYVHGFASSAQSGTVKRLQHLLPNTNVVAYDLPLLPKAAMELLIEKCNKHKPNLIVGTSMGGMYTEMLYGFDRICVNPAFEMGETMTQHNMVGKQKYLNPRENGETEFLVTKAIVKEYKEITTHCFSNNSDKEKQLIWGLFGDEDTLVNTYPIFLKHYPNAVKFHGGHHLTDHLTVNYLIPIMRRIDDKQNNIERKVIYINIDTMMDQYGKLKPSMKKAYKMLIETYNVYVVASSTTNNPQYLSQTILWIEEQLSAPAFNNVVFTNQPYLLYGDYMIDSYTNTPNFMGTTIKIGTPEMKTWEEVITFFTRLGGQ